MNNRVLVIIIAIIVVLGFLVLLKMCNQELPKPIFTIEPNDTVYVNNTVELSCTNIQDTMLSWNLGDGNTPNGIQTVHRYTKPGSYNVMASIGEVNSDPALIVVIAVAEARIVKPTIIIPPNIRAGETVTFENKSEGATKYSWLIKENGATGSFQDFDVTFDKPGNYLLFANIEGDNLKGSDSVIIKVLPEKPKVKKVTPVITPVIPKPPKPKPKPSEPKIIETVPDAYPGKVEFIKNFKEISEGLFNGESESMDRWAPEILKQTCNNQLNVVLKFVNNGKKTGNPIPTSANKFRQSLLFKSYKLVNINDAIGGGKKCFTEIILEVDSVNN